MERRAGGLAPRGGWRGLRDSRRDSRPREVRVEEVRGLRLRAGHEVPVQVERDADVGVAHERAERLGVDARGDHERGVRMSGVVQRGARQAERGPRVPRPLGPRPNLPVAAKHAAVLIRGEGVVVEGQRRGA